MYKCTQCGASVKEAATDLNGNRICFKCCGENDQLSLSSAKIGDKFMFYLTWRNNERPYISNWPGTMKINAAFYKTGRHNFARKRYDVWFNFKGKSFWGVTYGDSTQICHIKCVKSF